MQKTVCPDCRREVDIVVDHAAGDTVCMECGLLRMETFSDDSGSNDPVRVGGPSNPLLTDGGLSTTISRGNGSQGDYAALGKWQNHGTNPDRALLLAFKTIGTMADRLGLVSTIKDRADEIYKKVEDMKSIRGRSQDAILAACLYIACRQEDKPRTFKEIHSVANGATKKEIGRATNFIVKRLEEEMGKSMSMGSIHAGDFLRRFCSHLGMTNQAVRAATDTVKKVEELDIRKSPISIAAAAIYMISQVSEDKKPLKEISRVAGVAEATIKNSFNYLRPHATRLVPDWYCKPEDVKRFLAQ
ncbi:hypothetical protein SELMODRAFT_266576 [Selaginella moellendorffii]|uniref:TFIIB-type domain-containing protein n=1 Tax=Selaginella moellendorffii TaxID=88036 RepID=D8QNA2_SELML|nr:hypothetical protein SELMODRAFT_266576 [Selaginella moellendorffii]